jgi:hypothetical protein
VFLDAAEDKVEKIEVSIRATGVQHSTELSEGKSRLGKPWARAAARLSAFVLPPLPFPASLLSH